MMTLDECRRLVEAAAVHRRPAPPVARCEHGWAYMVPMPCGCPVTAAAARRDGVRWDYRTTVHDDPDRVG